MTNSIRSAVRPKIIYFSSQTIRSRCYAASYLQAISKSSKSRGVSSFSFAFELTNFMLTLGGIAKSTSRNAVPNFMKAKSMVGWRRRQPVARRRHLERLVNGKTFPKTGKFFRGEHMQVMLPICFPTPTGAGKLGSKYTLST
jgi:hypothetical protein